MKKALSALLAALLVLLPTPVYGQGADTWLGIPLATNYNLSSLSYIYCVTAGADGDPLSQGVLVNRRIQTSGSSTTTTAVVSGSEPFIGLSVGDEIGTAVKNVAGGSPMTWKLISAKASNNSITVDGTPTAAWDLQTGQPTGGYSFQYRIRTCATTGEAGWVGVSQLREVKYTFAINAVDTLSNRIDFRIECRDFGNFAVPTQVWGPGAVDYPAAGYTLATIASAKAVQIPEGWYQCRLGLLLTGTVVSTGITTKMSGRFIK